ncbi:MAG: alpha-hydroxy acid oxidase [Sciscionella sp.]
MSDAGGRHAVVMSGVRRGGTGGRAVVLRRRVAERLQERTVDKLHSVECARRIARHRLPKAVFDYIDGGADDEVTMGRNAAAFSGVTFRPRMALGSMEPELGVEVLGTRLDLPVLLAPCGFVELIHRDGAVGATRAAVAEGTCSVLSTVAGIGMEEVREKSGVPFWFQLYGKGGHGATDALCDRASATGVEVLVVTVDTPTYGNRQRDVRHGIAPPRRLDRHNVGRLGVQVTLHPSWGLPLMLRAVRLLGGTGRNRTVSGSSGEQVVASPIAWSDIERLRQRWQGRLVVKGLLGAGDARRAVDAGADGVIVSNHGGRQLDCVPSSLCVLPEVVDAVGAEAEVLVDGGIRRGSHVVAALALGARAVLIGRPYLYGLAVGGERGVECVLQLLKAEMRRTLVLLGCPSVDELGPGWLGDLQVPCGEWPVLGAI